MEYPPRVRALLDRAKADQGDAVAVRAKGEHYEGILMPHTSFSGEDVLTVKLPNGYNIGISVGDIESVELTAKHAPSAVQRHLPSGARGVIIPHGTDTLHFTTAALSFMLRDLTGPVVVVGAQRSSDRPSSDAASNLLSAARVSVANLGEVVAVMHGETSDTFGQIHRGTKVRKMHSSRRDAFRSLNATPLGRVLPDGTVELTDRALPRARGPAKVDDALDQKVALA